jgi:glucose/arabinose dehydrogenase
MSFFFVNRLCSIIVPVMGVILSLTLALSNVNYFEHVDASESVSDKTPNVFDSHLKIESIFQKQIKSKSQGGGSQVSSMTFLGTNDILLLNKNDGIVHRIVNGVLLEEPLLDVNVANKRERGMLGIDTASSTISNDYKDRNIKYVFLYYTESSKDGNDVCPIWLCEPGNDPLGNRLYRYELKDNKLVNPKLLLDLPATPGPFHNGGVIEIGPDNNVYVIIGDLLGYTNDTSKTKAQNFENGTNPDGRGGILRVTQDGELVNGKGILGDKRALKFYYAYGIRNSFGIDFDPVTGNLWDTENGPAYGDELNLVKPGFNSGWSQLQGMWKPRDDEVLGNDFVPGEEFKPDNSDLVSFDGRGKYSAPEFIWKQTVGPTAIKFLHSDKYGKEYKDDLFVGDFNNGYLYHFDLSKDRSGLSLNSPLEDKVADTPEELKEVIFGKGFGVITDIEVGPDGYLYILSHYGSRAYIFKIMPLSSD